MTGNDALRLTLHYKADLLQRDGLRDEQWVRLADVHGIIDEAIESMGFHDLLGLAEAILQHYPPGTVVCSHAEEADIGARTVAAIADLIDSARLARGVV